MRAFRLIGLLLAAALLLAALPLGAAAYSGGGAGGDEVLARAVANLNGANERPEPVATRGTGHFRAKLIASGDTLFVCYKLKWRKLTSNVVGAHIHAGGPEDVGPIVLDLGVVGLRRGDTRRCLDVTGLEEPEGDEFYVNVHTVNYPGGEIRGQLRFLPPSP